MSLKFRIAVGCLVICTGYLNAQVDAATLRGIVTNVSGAPVPGVKIEIINLGTNLRRSTMTGTGGDFIASNLAPGQYQVNGSLNGFVCFHLEMSLALGEERTYNIKMASGNESEVSAPADSQTPTTKVSNVADSSTVRDLPSNGRDWTQAATLQAGVSSVSTQADASNTNSGRGQRGFGSQITVSGARPTQNNYLLNGISTNDYANSAPGSVLGLDLGADAVEQFAVVTSSYPADFGRSSGGILNAITRSGSNAFHGSFYEFLRNSAFDARNFFDGPKPPFRRNQFGGAVGGPIRKDRSYFFVNYEGLRQSLGVTHIDTVPSPAARAGVLSTGNVTVDAQAARYLAFFPLPNRELLGAGDTGVFAFSGQQVTPEDYFTGRIDDKPREQDNISGSFVIDNSQTTQPDQLDVHVNRIRTQRRVVSLQDSHLFDPQTLNVLRFGVNRVVAFIGETPKALNPLAADMSYGFLPGHTSGNINVLGLTNFTGGLGSDSPYSFHWTSLQLYDDFSHEVNIHSIGFGAALERMRDNMLASNSPNGNFVFHSLSDFLTNRPFSLSLAIPGIVTPRDLRQTLVGAYVRDTLRLTKTFTMTAGIRYEMTTVPSEVAGRLSVLRTVDSPIPHLGNGYFANPTLRNFEPRLGFSYDPFGTGRMVVRAGFGTFDVLPLPYEFELISLFAAPYFENATPSNLPPGSFPGAALNPTLSTTSLRGSYIQPHPGRNYINQWNLNVQIQTSRNSSILVGYVGSRGIHQPFRGDDINIVMPTLTPAGYLWPSAGNGTKINPTVGRLAGLFWTGHSYYDGLQVQGNVNVGRSLQLQASYSWGKSIDTGSATIAGDQFENSVSSLPWFDLRRARGPSDFNLAHSGSVHFTYSLLQGRTTPWYLSNWRLTSTYRASTGAPFTAVIGGDPLGTHSTDPYDVPNVVRTGTCRNPINPTNPNQYLKLQCFIFPQPSTLLGNLSRNSLTGPGLSNLDLSLFKDNYIKMISDKFDLQLRIEAFNILNRANFAPPLDHRSIYDENGNSVPGAGLIDSTATPSRQIQLGVKVIW